MHDTIIYYYLLASMHTLEYYTKINCMHSENVPATFREQKLHESDPEELPHVCPRGQFWIKLF